MRTPFRSIVLVAVLSAATGWAQLQINPNPPLMPAQPLCAVPTLSLCQQAGYLDTACGQRQRVANSTCAVLLRNAGNSAQPATYQPTALSMNATGLRAFDAEQRHFNAQVPSRLAARQADQAQRATWLANPAIASCNEYVVEKYRELYAFEDAVFPLAETLRAAEVAARTVSPGVNRNIALTATQSIGPGGYVYGSERDNLFRQIQLGSYPNEYPVASRHVWDSTLLSRLNAGRRPAIYSIGWPYYASAAAQAIARGNTAATFAQARAVERKVSDFKARRDAIWTFRVINGVAVPTFNAAQIGPQLVALDREIEAALKDGVAMGCADANVLSVCDWDPERMMRQIHGAIGAARERDVRRCQRDTNDDFGALSQVRNASSVTGATKADYTTSVADLERYFGLIEAFRSNFDKQVPLTLSMAGLRRTLNLGAGAMSKRLGDSTFGVDSTLNYSGSVSWPKDKPCEATGAVQSSFFADALLFGGSHRAVTASVAVVSNPVGPATYAAHVEVPVPFGGPVTLVDTTGSFSTVNLVSLSPRVDKRITLVAQPFMIGPIPVTVSAGIAGRIGINLSMNLTTNRTCTGGAADFLSLKGHIDPYAELDAWAAAEVGIPGIATVGVEVTLAVFHAHLPFDSQLSLSFDGGAQARALLEGTVGLGLDLRTLDGRVDGKVTFVFIPITYELFRWSGLHYQPRLFDGSWTVAVLAEP